MAAKSKKKGPGSFFRIDDLAKQICDGNTTALARGITLLESRRDSDREKAMELLELCLVPKPGACRIGITGVPGVGKSTFIEALGNHLIDQGKRVAVLAVDPSSSLSKGSILGDKTRMQDLVRREEAFVRPSPTSETLGGVSRRTRETIILCEAAGFDIIIVETVGVGQSEIAVHGMVDFFLLLKLSGAGDELQGIKRGIMEMADAIVINKADGDNAPAARRAQMEFSRALELYPPKPDGWVPKVLSCSSLENKGVKEVWELIAEYFSRQDKAGGLAEKRRLQNKQWLFQTLEDQIHKHFYAQKEVQSALGPLLKRVEKKEITPFRAADELMALFHRGS